MPKVGDDTQSQERDRAMVLGMLKVKEYMKKCKEDGTPFKLTNEVIGKLVGRTERWVRNINKEIKSESASEGDVIKTKSRSGRPPKFTPQQIAKVTVNCANKRRASIRRSARRFNRNPRNTVTISKSTIYDYRKKMGFKPFHRINAPMITNPNKQDRVAFAKYFLEEFEIGIILPGHIVFQDEFYIYTQRKINTKNDIIWALSPSDIPHNLRYNRHARKPQCIGIAVAISVVGAWYAIKEEGESWNGEYFRTEIIPDVIEWIRGEADEPDKMILQHDCCPGYRAKATQKLLRDEWGVNKFIPNLNNSPGEIPRWPGNSPDLNPVENFGSIIMDMTEEAIDRARGGVGKQKLMTIIGKVIKEAAENPTLIDNLIMSFETRCEEIVRTGGQPLKY